MTFPICNLCKTHPADKKNSHIVSKFLCTRLFESTSPRHTLMIGKGGENRKLQDTPKENYILCSTCEKKIEVIETYFAKIITDIHNYINLPEKFTFINKGQHPKYLECKDLNPTLFKLFIYSLIWRVSISSCTEFIKFKLLKDIEEELRHFLNSSLTESHQTLMESANRITNIPNYHLCFLKPMTKSEDTRGIFTAYNIDESRHILAIVDFVVIMFVDDKLIDPILKVVSNKQNKKVLIGLGENNAWVNLNEQILLQMLEQ